MAVYQNSTANLGVKLEITHASPDVTNNKTTITYKAWVYKTGSHNPKNGLSQTPMYLTINGQSLVSTATGNYNLEGSTTSQLIKSGTLDIPHNSDGSKSFTFSWNVNFTSTNFPYQDFGYRSVTTSGTYVLPNIARASTFTIPSTTITTDSSFTVSISRASGSFKHKVSYIVGSSEVEWTTSADTTYSATIPHSLFNAYKSVDSVAGVIRVTTMNGTVVVGSNQTAVTINLASSAIPSFSSVTYTNSNKGMFSRTDQFIRGLSRATATVNTPLGSYSSTISSYEFRYRKKTSYSGSTSTTTNSYQFDAFNFPESGSENEVFLQARVRDSRGRYSAWQETTDIRVHYYKPPAIGAMTVRRTGSGNTTLQVTRNYTVLSMYELGGSTNNNTASLSFQHRTKGTTAATNNTGAKSTTMYLTNSNANLAGTFAANTSYEVRAILTDKLNTVYGSWISVGTEFVPMDISPKGVGIGKIHSDGAKDLEVGTGGIYSYGGIVSEGYINSIYSGHTLTMGAQNSAYNHFTTTAPAHYFNKKVHVAGDVFAGSNYMRKLAYQDEVNSSYGNSVLATVAEVDNMVTPGVYQYSGTVLSHIGAYGLIIARVAGGVGVYNGTNNWLYQTAYATNGNIYERRRINAGAWSGWTRMPLMSDLSSMTTITTGNNGNGNWYQVGSGLLVCSQNFSFANKYSDFTLTGYWTFPKAFSSPPSVSATGRTSAGLGDNQEIMNGALNQVGNTSTTGVDFSWHKFSGAAFGTSSRKYLTVFAIGFP